MAGRSRTRRVLKWGGTLLCAALVFLFLLGIFVEVQIDVPGHCLFYIGGGGIIVSHDSAFQHFGVHAYALPAHMRWLAMLPNEYAGDVYPYWISLLVVGLPTVGLWVFDRRRVPAGHCGRCGYNLTGNVSGVCPECGTEAASSGAEGRADR